MLWVGSPNFFPGGLHDVVALVLHTMVGTLASCDSQFQLSAGSPVSAHFGVALDGTTHQYVSLEDGAWANGILEAGNRWQPEFGSENPNYRTISIETEDDGHPNSEPVTDVQFNAIAALFETVIRPRWPTITTLAAHRAISPISRSCPAARWLDTGKFAELAGVLELEVLT